MLQLILKTHLAFLLIPLITLALEPSNPVTFCERFLGDADKAVCTNKMNKDHFDWYAAAACSLQDDDSQFYGCLDEIKEASFNPEALDLCAKSAELSDSDRLSCLQKIKNKDYTRSEITKCAAKGASPAIASCLAGNGAAATGRKPASHKTLPGFQSLEIRH